jgi:hypothetical protein
MGQLILPLLVWAMALSSNCISSAAILFYRALFCRSPLRKRPLEFGSAVFQREFYPVQLALATPAGLTPAPGLLSHRFGGFGVESRLLSCGWGTSRCLFPFSSGVGLHYWGGRAERWQGVL